jgi:hypothetical protein
MFLCPALPFETNGLGVKQDIAEPIQKIVPVRVIKENLPPIDSPHNDMMQRSWGVDTGFPRNIFLVSNTIECVNRVSEERPRLLLYLMSLTMMSL